MKKILLFPFILMGSFITCAQNRADTSGLPYFLRDRGIGIPTSMFGTYIEKGETILYPFYEYYYDRNAEYKPAELGYLQETDYRGKYIAHEGLLFLSHGIAKDLSIEMEAAIIRATLYKSADDHSAMPDQVRESGLGDVEGQLRYRWFNENSRRPELFSYFETVFPLQKNRKLIGTQHWEFKFGSGIIKGFHWGTITLRGAVEYNTDEKKIIPGELALEYLKKFSRLFRMGLIIEGSQDKIGFIIDLQFHISPHVFIRVNNGAGITSKATDLTPEIGLLLHF